MMKSNFRGLCYLDVMLVLAVFAAIVAIVISGVSSFDKSHGMTEYLRTETKGITVLSVDHDGHRFVICTPTYAASQSGVSIIHSPSCKCMETK